MATAAALAPPRAAIELRECRDGLLRLTRGPDIVPEGLVSARPLSDGPTDCLLRLEPNGRMGAQVAAVGCLVGPNHYSSQNIPAIGKHRLHNAAQALLQVSARGHTPPHFGSLHARFQGICERDGRGRGRPALQVYH